MTPPAKAGGFSEERLLASTAAFQATAQVSPCGHLSRLAPEGPIRALKRGTACRPQGLKATLPALCRGGRPAASSGRQAAALYSAGIARADHRLLPAGRSGPWPAGDPTRVSA